MHVNDFFASYPIFTDHARIESVKSIAFNNPSWYRRAIPTYGITRKNFSQGVQMKRFLFPLLLSFVFSIFFLAVSFAADARTITILYTGSVKGTVDPCPS